MANQARTISGKPAEESLVSLNFSENPAAMSLLDIIVSILSEEYIRTAKENPEIFSK
jgi:hypothetical protein